MDKIHLDIIFKGDIQNKGFAFQIMKAAEKLNICGYTQYVEDNMARVEAEGNKKDLDKFIYWCKNGMPEIGKIDIQIIHSKYRGYNKFAINDIQILF